LRAALAGGLLAPNDLLDMIEAREAEAEPAIETYEAWLAYLRGGPGALAVAAGRALGATEDELPVLRLIGAAYGVAGLLRSQVVLATQGRCLLPMDCLAAAGLSLEAAVADPLSPALAPVRACLARAGQAMLPLASARRLSRPVLAAGLPGVLARRDLKNGHHLSALSAGRSFGDKLAVVLHAWRGVV
jgi:phytoene synthase